jgi:predicted ATP-grasp superfamily ATP-dependent carboligase
MRILVVGYLNKSPVAGIRALARAGHSVDLAVPRHARQPKASLLFRSRYARHGFALPHPLDDIDGFTRSLLDVVRAGEYRAVLPWDHHVGIPIARRLAEFSALAGFAMPDAATYERVHDKAALHRWLKDRGFDVPRFYDYVDLADLKKQAIRFPVVVKARRCSGVREGTRYASTMDELERAFVDIESRPSACPELDDFHRPFVQEYVQGTGHDGLFLFNRGAMRAAVTQQRVVTYPLNGGVGIFNKTTREPELIDYGRKMLEALGWHGPCQVETKKDARDGRYRLVEINPRFWGPLDLAIRAGVNFPLLAAELAATGECAETYNYRVGVAYRSLFPVTFMSICRDRGHRLRRLLELRDLVRRDTHCEVDWRDPMPNLLDIGQTVHTLLFKQRTLLDRDYGRVGEK